MSDETKTQDDLAERLAAARARKAVKESAKSVDRARSELEKLELEERFEKELGGPLGQAFAIVDASHVGEGFIAIKLGEDVLWNTYKSAVASRKDGANVVETESYVLPCVVHPSKDDYRKIVKRRPFLSDECALALSGLYGFKRKDEEGK